MQSETFLHLDVWNLPEMIDIKPEKGGSYIHAATEAFNEEGEQDEEVVRNWTEHLGFTYHQLHASGHAPASGVRDLIERVGPRTVVPIHTEHPELFEGFRKGRGWRLRVPVKGKQLPMAA